MSKSLVVITGASSGIGEAIAKKLSAEGYPLLLLSRRLERMEALKLPNTLCKAVDVTDRAAVAAAIATAEAQYGKVDCLINNAGVMLLGFVAEQSPTEWETMLDVNIKGMLNGIHCVLKDMQARKSGTIINVSSVAGIKTFANHAVYCGTKFAVHGMSETLREEVSNDNVRVMLVSPGAVETELLSHTTNDAVKQGYEDWKTEIGGAISADDIANCVSFAYNQPQNVCIRDIVVAATRQQS